MRLEDILNRTRITENFVTTRPSFSILTPSSFKNEERMCNVSADREMTDAEIKCYTRHFMDFLLNNGISSIEYKNKVYTFDKKEI